MGIEARAIEINDGIAGRAARFDRPRCDTHTRVIGRGQANRVLGITNTLPLWISRSLAGKQ